MRSSSACLSAIALIVNGAPAWAQGASAPPGKFAPRSETISQNALSAEMARCAVKRDRRGAEAVAAARDEQAKERAEARIRDAMIACLKGRHSATLNELHVSGAIAEALLSENDGAMLSRLAALPPRVPARVSEGAGSWRAAISCAVAGAPAEAATLLRASAESPAEVAAFRAMVPTLQACVPASGGVTLKPSSVRVAVAIAAYQLLNGASAPGGTN